MPNAATASSSDHPWRWVGAGLAAFTIYKAATGKRTDPILVVTSALTIAAFLRDL